MASRMPWCSRAEGGGCMTRVWSGRPEPLNCRANMKLK